MAVKLPVIQTQNQELNMLQTQWAKSLYPVTSNPLNFGTTLVRVSLAVGDNVISHGLGRALMGWFPVRVRAATTIYDKQDANSTPALTLVLNSSAAVVVDLLVY